MFLNSSKMTCKEPAMFLHTRLKVRDLDRSIAFYSTHFGMVCRDRKTSPRGSQLAFMTMPGSPTELELAYLPWDPDFHLPEDIFHLAFSVEDMGKTLAGMRESGVKVTEEPSGRRDGGEMAFIEDPDGYEIELLSFTPESYRALQAEIAAVR
jgi:lactoylglutathione lyase